MPKWISGCYADHAVEKVSIDLVTIAGTEYAVQTNLAQYEDVAQLENDILCFLPTVSDLDVFGCELDLLDLHTQRLLPEAFHTVLLQRPKLQIVVRPCMVDGHSIWQFEADGRESYPKAIRVPANPRGEIADRAFYAAPVLRHVEVAMGIQHVGFAAWQSCQQLQIVKLPSVISLEDGTFQGCCVLREVAAPGCVQHRPEGAFCGAGVEQLCQVTFTISGHGPVKTAKDLRRSTSRAQKSQPGSTPPLPTAWL